MANLPSLSPNSSSPSPRRGILPTSSCVLLIATRLGRRHESQQVPSSLVQVVFVTVSLLMPQAFHRPLHALPSSPLTLLMPTFRHCQPLLDLCLALRTMAPTFSHFHALSSSAYSFYFIIMHACHRVDCKCHPRLFISTKVASSILQVANSTFFLVVCYFVLRSPGSGPCLKTVN